MSEKSGCNRMRENVLHCNADRKEVFMSELVNVENLSGDLHLQRKTYTILFALISLMHSGRYILL